MNFLNSPFFKKYLLPGFVFQSVIIAGGYGTGREIVEYFLNYGPLGGLFGMVVTTLVWSVVLAIVFEFARYFHAFDYRTFCRKLLGPFWLVFEIIYLFFILIVLAVVGSAAGLILRDNFSLPYLLGVSIMFITVVFFTFRGSQIIEKFFSVWSILLYFVYAVFLIVALFKFGTNIQTKLWLNIILPNWAVSGFRYALYNLGLVAGILFCLNHVTKRKEAIWAGLIGGVIGILPAFLFYIATIGFYPEILSKELPSIFLLQEMGVSVLLFGFQIVLFGTLIETGTALIHSVNERIQTMLERKGKVLPQWQRPLIAVVFLIIALAISTFGLINLIAKGYGAASLAFLFVFILPLIFFGIYKIVKKTSRPTMIKND